MTGNNLLLEISNGVRFTEGGRIRIEDRYNQLRIGENTCLINVFFSLADKGTFINVGRDCLFSAGVVIRSSDSHSIINQDNRRINMGKPISIGDHVWIGNGATILKGVNIGGGSVVGTEAVITKDVPENSIAVGNPGKIVRENIRWQVERILP